jgi:membrane associated rhomboid family serine protease
MSYYQQENRSKLGIGQDGNTLTMLIAVQLVAFVLLAFVKVIYYFTYGKEGLATYHEQVLNWVALPAHLPTLLTRPWTIITHFFVHDGVWHILGNMLWLWAFGYILQDLTSTRKVVPIFIYGAFAGALAYLLSFNLIPTLGENIEQAKALGASAGVMAISIAATALAPRYKIFPMIMGGIPLWVFTTIFVVIDLATIPYNNAGGHIAHLAGAGMGLLFITMLRRGSDWSDWMNSFFDWVNNLFNPDKPKKGKTVKSQLFYKTKVPPYKKNAHVTQQRIDEILDKISQKGYNSLTPDEKDILKRASGEES